MIHQTITMNLIVVSCIITAVYFGRNIVYRFLYKHVPRNSYRHI